jgi:hypothetical protein
MELTPGEILSHYTNSEFTVFPRQSLVVIETYSNNSFRGDPQGLKTFILDGLDVPRLFYSPRYDDPERNNPVYDGRTTLLWEPSVKTDITGQATVGFFTGDRKTVLEVDVNGMEASGGNPGQGKLLIGN